MRRLAVAPYNAVPASSIEPLAVASGVATVRPQGESSLVAAVELVKSAIAQCRERRVTRLLVNITGLTGIAVPTTVDRFLMVEDWAHTANGLVQVALVAPARYIHPEKFGSVLAAKLGLTADVFTTEETALRWLADPSYDPALHPLRR